MRGLRKKKWVRSVAIVAMLASQMGAPLLYADSGNSNDNNTLTPIKHVVLIIGENRTFDNVFGTYQPPSGQSVWNLLSEGIVKSDGTPGSNAYLATQYQANDTDVFSIHPTRTDAFDTLPQPKVGGPETPYFSTTNQVAAVEPALEPGDDFLLTIGGTGVSGSLDTRFPADLSNDPFQITSYINYDSYAGSPVHRFFQMWQELDCDRANATASNPSGCAADLFPWVEVTVATGSNGNPEPSGFKGEGAIAMGFYNNAAGDAPYMTALAQQYTLSDNDHQAIMGGTGANHLAIGYGETIYFADSKGNPAVPPDNQIENPNPQPGTNNFYTEDGYSGGSYVNCSDPAQPGVKPVMDYINGLSYAPWKHGNCQNKAYYIVNNYNPGYYGTGEVAYQGGSGDFTVPPTQENNLGLELSKHNVSWRYYGEGWANGTESGEQSNGAGGYCNICNPFLYSTQVMTNPSLRANLKDITDLYSDIQNGSLPAVSIVKPDGFLDGHPASSRWDLFEAFCKKIIDMTQANPTLWASTAIVITVDEGGGYYDSGYVQPIDFFGDGTRIPLLVVSPYSAGGRVVHTYYDHVSFAKFVEKNWNLPPISSTSRDNLPNPVAGGAEPYVPLNGPAIGDLMDMFNFPH
jgi:phospholipase C